MENTQKNTVYNSNGNVLLPDGVYTGTITGKSAKLERESSIYEFEIDSYTSLIDKQVRIVVSNMRAQLYMYA